MMRYRDLRVVAGAEDSAALGVCRPVEYRVQLRKYFLMDWAEGSDEMRDYSLVTRRLAPGQARAVAEANRAWFAQNRQRIQTAAMGKGAPEDYALALEWAVRSGRIREPSAETIQRFCDEHLGIDCSGFATNYLVAAGLREYSATLLRGTSAQSYYRVGHAVNDAAQIRRGDLLVWMDGNVAKHNPGHIAVVESYSPTSRPGGNMRVVEATGAANANPKLLDSWYSVDRIIDRNDRRLGNQVMVLEVTRHRVSGSRVAVMRPV
jgi:hypothetical protein